jgi:hypothetical protein
MVEAVRGGWFHLGCPLRLAGSRPCAGEFWLDYSRYRPPRCTPTGTRYQFISANRVTADGHRKHYRDGTRHEWRRAAGCTVTLAAPCYSERGIWHNGQFAFTGLSADVYKLTVTAPGMRTFTSPQIPLHAGETRIVPAVTLAVFGGATSVTRYSFWPQAGIDPNADRLFHKIYDSSRSNCFISSRYSGQNQRIINGCFCNVPAQACAPQTPRRQSSF